MEEIITPTNNDIANKESYDPDIVKQLNLKYNIIHFIKNTVMDTDLIKSHTCVLYLKEYIKAFKDEKNIAFLKEFTNILNNYHNYMMNDKKTFIEKIAKLIFDFNDDDLLVYLLSDLKDIFKIEK